MTEDMAGGYMLVAYLTQIVKGYDMNLKLKTKILESRRSQRDIAKALDIHDTRLSEFVQEWKEPTEEQKNLIANELNCKVEDIF